MQLHGGRRMRPPSAAGHFSPSPEPLAIPCVQFASSAGAPVLVPARLLRTQPCADGRVEAVLCFAWDEV
jgi:hypothetical protein